MEISFPLHLIMWHKIKKQLLAFFVHALVIDSRGFLEEVVTSVNPLFSQENHEASVTVGEQEEHSTNEDCGYRGTISTPAGDVTVASNGWLSCSEAEKPGDPPSFLFSVVWQQTLLKHWSHTGSMWWEVMCALILDTHFSRRNKGWTETAFGACAMLSSSSLVSLLSWKDFRDVSLWNRNRWQNSQEKLRKYSGWPHIKEEGARKQTQNRSEQK